MDVRLFLFFDHRCLHGMIRIGWSDRMSNVQAWNLVLDIGSGSTLSQCIQPDRLRSLCHALLMANTSTVSCPVFSHSFRVGEDRWWMMRKRGNIQCLLRCNLKYSPTSWAESLTYMIGNCEKYQLSYHSQSSHNRIKCAFLRLDYFMCWFTRCSFLFPIR